MSGALDFSDTDWPRRVRSVLDRYGESLVRRVAGQVIRPRVGWSADDVREKLGHALTDPVPLDRALRGVSADGRRLLKIIALSRRPVWRLTDLTWASAAMGAAEGLDVVAELLGSAVVFPHLSDTDAPIETLDAWLARAAFAPLQVFAPPAISERCRAEDLNVELPPVEAGPLSPVEADGLEWLVRLSVLWQLLVAGPMRKTQVGGLFKRDLDRLRASAVLSGSPADALTAVADPPVLALVLGEAVGVVRSDEEQVVAGLLPANWGRELTAALIPLWAALTGQRAWDPLVGWAEPWPDGPSPFTAGVVLIATLADRSPGSWFAVDAIAEWAAARFPNVAAGWVEAFLLGVAHQLRLVEAAKVESGWAVRLSATGRGVAAGVAPAAAPLIEQTLLVQPNLEMIAYRQGLTPKLIGQLTKAADWKAVGMACTLTLSPTSVERALNAGGAVNDVLRLLERHSSRPVPDVVNESIRGWAGKRERLVIYPSAFLLEFRTASELNEALKAGLIEAAVTDRIGLVARESAIDYQQFRLVGTRDYRSPDERCVEADANGLILTIQEHRADLLAESELRQFAEPIGGDGLQYRLTPASLRDGRHRGYDARTLADWFARRVGQSVPAVVKLLHAGRDAPPVAVKSQLVMRVSTVEIADGLEQWPEARPLLGERLGPTAFTVDAEMMPALRQLLNELGCQLDVETAS